MISDEELKRAIECDIESEVTQFCGMIGPSVIDHKVMLEAGIEMQEMARELLQLREEKRQAEEARAKSWKDAPEWAKYRARDFNGDRHYYATMPKISNDHDEWFFSDSDMDVRYELIKPDYPDPDWKDTLEERP